MSDFGIAVAADNKSMQDGGWKFDSRKKKLTVDVEMTPKHLDILNIDGGSKWVMNPNDVMRETLFKIEHHMPWPPKFLFFALMTNTPIGMAGMIGAYYFNIAMLRTNNFPIGDEYVYAMVDDKYFYINHVASAGAANGNGTTVTAFGSDFKLKVRYEILNQKAIFLGQETFDLSLQ